MGCCRRLIAGFPDSTVIYAPVFQFENSVFNTGNLPEAGFDEFKLNRGFVGRFDHPDEVKLALQGNDPGFNRKLYFTEINSPPGKFSPDSSSDPKVSGLPQFWPPVLKSIEDRVNYGKFQICTIHIVNRQSDELSLILSV